MLRIDRTGNGQVVLTLSGRMQTEDIEQIEQLLVVEPLGKQLRLNLRDTTLVNQDVIAFFADCEISGIVIDNCPRYIRDWIDQEKRQRRQKRES